MAQALILYRTCYVLQRWISIYEIRDLTANLLTKVLVCATAIVEDGARLDIAANGFWGGPHERSYSDYICAHAPSNSCFIESTKRIKQKGIRMATEVTHFYKRLASSLASQWDHFYSTTTSCMASLPGDLLVIALGHPGVRSSCGHTCHQWTLLTPESHLSLDY